MNANQYRARLTDGIPLGSLAKANRLTLLGVGGGLNTSGRGYQARSTFDQARAGYAVNLELAQNSGRPFPAKSSPYSALIARQYYGAGLGDDAPSDVEDSATWTGATPSPVYTTMIDLTGQQTNIPGMVITSPASTYMSPQPTSGSGSGWADILNSGSSKSIFAGLGTGLANLIGGGPRAALPLSSSLFPSSAPSLGTMLLIGGGLAAAFFLFKRSAT